MGRLLCVEGDLLFWNGDCIVQQCNCVTVTAKGLSDAIEKRYVYANVYSNRAHGIRKKNKLGDVVYCKPIDKSSNDPVVVCLMTQAAPGKPGLWCRNYGIDPQCDTRRKVKSFRCCTSISFR